jgi:hypothetical protein
MKVTLPPGVEKPMSLEAALRTYQRQEASAQWCAHAAGLSLWEFLDEMKAHNVPFVTDEDSLWEQLAEFRASLDSRPSGVAAGPLKKSRDRKRKNGPSGDGARRGTFRTPRRSVRVPGSRKHKR